MPRCKKRPLCCRAPHLALRPAGVLAVGIRTAAPQPRQPRRVGRVLQRELQAANEMPQYIFEALDIWYCWLQWCWRGCCSKPGGRRARSLQAPCRPTPAVQQFCTNSAQLHFAKTAQHHSFAKTEFRKNSAPRRLSRPAGAACTAPARSPAARCAGRRPHPMCTPSPAVATGDWLEVLCRHKDFCSQTCRKAPTSAVYTFSCRSSEVLHDQSLHGTGRSSAARCAETRPRPPCMPSPAVKLVMLHD